MTEIETPLYDYCSSYEDMTEEIQEGIAEGFNEGLREGIKQGFIDGIKECRDLGFSNIDVKSMEEVLETPSKSSPTKLYKSRSGRLLAKSTEKMSALLLRKKWKRHVIKQ